MTGIYTAMSCRDIGDRWVVVETIVYQNKIHCVGTDVSMNLITAALQYLFYAMIKKKVLFIQPHTKELNFCTKAKCLYYKIISLRFIITLVT